MLKIFFYGRQIRDVELYKLYMRCVEFYVGTLVKWNEDKREEPRVCFSRGGKELESLSGIPTQDKIIECVRKYF